MIDETESELSESWESGESGEQFRPPPMKRPKLSLDNIDLLPIKESEDKAAAANEKFSLH